MTRVHECDATSFLHIIIVGVVLRDFLMTSAQNWKGAFRRTGTEATIYHDHSHAQTICHRNHKHSFTKLPSHSLFFKTLKSRIYRIILSNEVGQACGTHGRGDENVDGFGGKSEGERPLGRLRCRWRDGVRMDRRETGSEESVEWIPLAQDRDRWRALA
jgi:hypothetical protein